MNGTSLILHDLPIDIASAKFVRPDLGALIAVVKPQTGSDREQLAVPVAPSDDLSDTMLFEDPREPSKRYYLPRYTLATVRSNGPEAYRVRLDRTGHAAALSVVLTPQPAAEVSASDPDAIPLAHELSALLRFDLPSGGGMQREIPFPELVEVEGGVKFSALLSTAADLDDVFWALTRLEQKAQLVVRRLVRVGVPVAVRDHRSIDKPILSPHGPTGEGVEMIPTSSLIRDFRPGGGVITLPWLPTHPTDVLPPTTGGSGPVAVTQYRETERILEQIPAPNPFVFSPDMHSYIFGTVNQAGGPGDLVLDQVVYNGVHHSYYHRTTRPEVVYYLPDSFKMARVTTIPRAPFMSVLFETPDGSVENTLVTVMLVASPYVDEKRRAAAAAALRQRRHGAPDAGPELDMQPLLADSSRLSIRLTLPGSAGAEKVPGAMIDLRAGLSLGFKVPLAQFQRLFDALQTRDGATLLSGEIEVALGHADRPAELVPFFARVDDLAGDVLDIESSPRPEGPGFVVTARNAIESPVRLGALTAFLLGPAGVHPCTISGLPADDAPLAPGDAVQLTVVPEPGFEGPFEAPTVETSTVTVLPDKEAIWGAICDDTTSFLQRTVTVKTPALMFEPPADPSQQILELVVEIGPPAGGLTETISLNAAALAADTTITIPFGDVILRREDAGTYRYRVSAVRADRVREGEWKTRSGAVLWIVTGDIP